MTCKPLRGGGWVCGDSHLSVEDVEKIEQFRRYLTLKTAGEKLPPFKDWREEPMSDQPKPPEPLGEVEQ